MNKTYEELQKLIDIGYRNVVGYARASTPQQFYHGTSINRQHEIIEEAVKDNPPLQLNCIIDVCASAWLNDDKLSVNKIVPHLKKLIPIIEEKDLKDVILMVEDIDRFDRGSNLTHVRDIKKRNISVYSIWNDWILLVGEKIDRDKLYPEQIMRINKMNYQNLTVEELQKLKLIKELELLDKQISEKSTNEIYTIDDVANKYGVCTRTIRRIIKSNNLIIQKTIGGHFRFSEDNLKQIDKAFNR